MTSVIAILALAALCWGAVLAYRGSIVGGCAVYVIATCCLGNAFWSLDAVGLTWTLDRFYLLGLVALFAAQTLIRRTDPKPIGPSELIMLGFFLLLIASTFSHDWRTLGPDQVSVLMHLVNGYLIPAMIYWIAREAALNERGTRFVQMAFACFGVYLVLTAICEILQLWPFVFPRYISDPKVGIHFGRARGPMVQSAQLGTFLITCFVATAILCRWHEAKGRVGRLIPVFLFPLYASAIFFTYTRSVWMGAGLALALVVSFLLKGRRRNLTLGSMALAAVLVLAFKGGDLVSMQRETSGSVTRESTYMRASFAYVSWQIFKDHPLTGVGFGQFPRTSPYYLSDRDTALHLEAIRGYIHHNTYLSVLVELGLVGLVLFLAMLISWTRNGLLLCRDPRAPSWMRGHALFMLAAFAVYFCQLMFHEVSYSPQENSLIFLLAGMTSGLRAMQVREVSPAVSRKIVQGRIAPSTAAWSSVVGR